MQLITDEYRNLNEQLHDDNKHYGTSGAKYVKDVLGLAHQIGSQDILDYGCGKSTLANNLPFKIKQYDPAVTKYKKLPDPADIVICTDVLEHIEPDLIDNVLKHIAEMTKKVAYLVANTKPAVKTLADGRNAHILIRSPEWWCKKMFEYFTPITFADNEGNVVYIVKAKEAELNEQKTEETSHRNNQINERPETESETEPCARGNVEAGRRTDHAGSVFFKF